MTQLDPIIIQRSKIKLIKLCLLCAVFIALGIWHLIPDPSFEGRYFADSTVRDSIGYTLIFVFGIFIIYPAYKLFDNTPALTLDEDGIVDNSSTVSVGRIGWNDIESISTTQQSNTKFITIHVQDPEKFIDRERSSIKRNMMLANHKRTGSPINISTNILAISHENLMELLEERLLAFRVGALGKISEL